MSISDDDVIEEVAQRLALEPSGTASDLEINELELRVGAKLPSAFSAFLRRFNGCANAHVGFDGDAVLFSAVPDILAVIQAYGLEGTGSVPFADDFFGSVWLLTLRPDKSGAPGGRVDFIRLPEQYQDPEHPIEHRAEDFVTFLRSLTVRQ